MSESDKPQASPYRSFPGPDEIDPVTLAKWENFFRLLHGRALNAVASVTVGQATREEIEQVLDHQARENNRRLVDLLRREGVLK